MKKLILFFLLFSYSTGYSLTVDFSGTVTTVNDSFDSFGGAISVGDTFSGSYMYDNTPDIVDPGTNLVQYQFKTGLNGVTIHIGSLTFQTDLSDPNLLVRVHNDRDLSNDVFHWISYNNLDTEGVIVETISFRLNDDTRTALDSTDLPNTAPDLSLWDPRRLWITGGFLAEIDIIGDITFAETAPAVPEPLSLILCCLGSAAIWLKKRLF